MADYIDRNILCQAYIHIDPVRLDDDQAIQLKRHLEAFISSRGQFFLYEQVATDVEFKEGSLKVYATIAGALYIAIGQYGSFRDGVNFLAQDTKRLAECVVSESLFLSRSRHDNTVRAEARTGVVGSLKGAVDKLGQIRSELGDVPLRSSINQIADIQVTIEKIIGNLRDSNDPPFVADGLCAIVEEMLPHRPPHRPSSVDREDVIVSYRKQRAELVSFLKKTSNRKRST
ncbi:hypothetical protein [Nevskia soli]|uniref:hypothetical protein n=1 Tax=Nevskia soli TaxID=418856 RepID=UPI0012F96627|nr:hypothetical protein [Nevskia soli]